MTTEKQSPPFSPIIDAAMEKPAHTPGPWSVHGINMQTGSISIGPKGGRFVIADVTNAASLGEFLAGAIKRGSGGLDPDDGHTQWANARLIAAAPDLLAALTEAQNFLRAWAHTMDMGCWPLIQIDAAIARATGGKP